MEVGLASLGLGLWMRKDDAVPSRRRALKRMSSPERWEVKQLIAVGVLSATEHPMYDEEADGMLCQEEGAEEQTEIDNNEDLPQFLLGEGEYFGEMSPVRIVENPEGSLRCAAALQSALIKERREVHDQQQRALLDSIPKDLGRSDAREWREASCAGA